MSLCHAIQYIGQEALCFAVGLFVCLCAYGHTRWVKKSKLLILSKYVNKTEKIRGA